MEEQNQITFSSKTPQNKWKIATIIVSVCSIIVIATLSYMLISTNINSNDTNGMSWQQNSGPGNFGQGQQGGTSQEGVTPPDANSGATQNGGSSDSGNSSDSSDSSTF